MKGYLLALAYTAVVIAVWWAAAKACGGIGPEKPETLEIEP